MRLSARKLLKAKPVELLKNLHGKYELEFDSGDRAEVKGFDIVVSRYCWEFFNKFPALNIDKSHLITSHMKTDKAFTSGAFRNLMSKIMVEVFDHYSEFDNEVMYQLQKEVWSTYMNINEEFYNDILVNGGRYKLTLNIEDILGVMFHPEVLAIKEKYPVNQETVTDPNYIFNIYKRKQKVIESPEFEQNNISIMARSGVIKIPQLMQCVGPRGSVTDINSEIFPEPIPVGYMDGFNKIHDALIESRTAAMSLNNQSDPLRFTEYFSRRVQFLGMQLKNLHFADCGSTFYLEYQVRDHRQGYVISDLEFLEGMNYLVEEESTPSNPVYRPVKRTDTHLIGKRLKIRNVIGCQHPDPIGCCSVCFGEASRSIPKYRNLGHFCVILFTQIISQLVLSTKHHTSSAVGSAITLQEDAAQYFVSMLNGVGLGMREEVKHQFESIKLVISEEAIEGLTDIDGIDDVALLSPSKTSAINRIKVVTTDKAGNVQEDILDVVPYSDVGFLTMHMLKFMKEVGWTHSNDGFVEIDLMEFDSELPIIEITPRQANMFQYAKGLEKIIKSSVKEIKKRATATTPESFLIELSDAVNQRLGINLSILQVIAYTILAVDVEGKDYSLPKPHTRHAVGTMDTLLQGRSISAALAYEKQGRTLSSPNSFKYINRPPSPFDEMFVPDLMDLEYTKMKV